MELKSVEIVGFKSFADRLTLTFHGGITAIVGPNGSGKSNVSDAIRWVLGEQSAKSLRGSRMEDVIFAGTERRRPVNYAQVTLVLGNQDRSLNYDYDEVAISRKMYRSGESEYLINGVRCRLKDVQELLMDTGIGKDGYSIIGQGRIDQLLSNKPQDRRMIFEEAAGIVKFKVRREEANKQLIEERTNLQTVSGILDEASLGWSLWRSRHERRKIYLERAEELKGLEVQTFLRQYDQLMGQHTVAQQKLEDLRVQLEEARTLQAEGKKAIEAAQKEAEEAEAEASAAVRALNDLRVRRESQDGDRRVYQEKTEQLRKDKKNAQIQLEEAEIRLNRRTQTYAKEQEQLRQLQSTLVQQQEQQSRLAVENQKVQEDYRICKETLDAEQKKREELRQTLDSLRDSSARQEVRQEQEQGQQGDIEQRLQSLQEALSSRGEDAKEKQELLQKTQAEYDAYSQKVLELTDQISAIREKQKQAVEAQQEAQQKVRQAQSRIQWLQELEHEYEGYAGSVKAIMQRTQMNPEQYRGVLGTVADVIQVPARLSTAIEIALGGAVQNIITDTQQTAKELIEYLRGKKAGRATFLPLDQVHGREVRREEQMLNMPGVIGYANELIGYDIRYQKIFSRLLGNVVVAENFDYASAVANRYGQYLRVVTLKGDIFNIGGAITGGSTGGKTATILNRKGELDTLHKELAAAQEEGRQCEKAAAELAAQRQSQAEQMNTFAQKREEASAVLTKKQSDYDQAELLLQMAQNQLEEAQKEKALLVKNLQENQSSMDKLRQELGDTQRAFEECSARVEAQSQAEEAGRRQKEEMRTQMMQNRIELSTSEQLIASMQRSAESEKIDIEQDQQSVQQYTEQIEEAEEKLVRLIEETKRFEAELGEVGKAIQEYAQKIDILNQKKAEKEAQHRKTIAAAQESIQTVSSLEKEEYRLDTQAGRAKKDLAELQDRIWEKYELTYNAALRMELPPVESHAAVQRRIAELREEIKALGSVNIHAIEEYETLRERCDFLRSQLEDVRNAEASLQDIINQLTEQMEKQFREGFGKISEQFNQVFRQMFGGGKGMLRLEEDGNPLESGIEIIAQPPGKTLKNMAALSGGERALTAIAILFAIQQLKPAPFCILDEIEAALDDANVNRYAEFLKTLCGTTQFIVITHRKGTMEAASTMYGITMEEKGVSKCISVKFE